jgi:hypothetical protein
MVVMLKCYHGLQFSETVCLLKNLSVLTSANGGILVKIRAPA